ncbi:MAG: CcoQ/FixQ family Cbb3-type cytochrome c oxidase assembly chaperone [Bernardetiaceae bacterium]|nr:CcoQ/FixQ family Cbb3-type cytochrome c oxidase assembly chaperone [Bernardetiaceae bacterium]
MIRNVLENIGGIEIYPIISLTIFFTVFSTMLVYVFTRKKKQMDKMAGLPLEP